MNTWVFIPNRLGLKSISFVYASDAYNIYIQPIASEGQFFFWANRDLGGSFCRALSFQPLPGACSSDLRVAGQGFAFDKYQTFVMLARYLRLFLCRTLSFSYLIKCNSLFRRACLAHHNAHLSCPKPGHTTGRLGLCARRGGGAGSGTTGRRQNSLPKKHASLVPYKASTDETRCLFLAAGQWADAFVVSVHPVLQGMSGNMRTMFRFSLLVCANHLYPCCRILLKNMSEAPCFQICLAWKIQKMFIGPQPGVKSDCCFATCRIQNPDIPRGVGSRRKAWPRGGVGQDWTPTEQFAHETSVPRTFQGIEETSPERLSRSTNKQNPM